VRALTRRERIGALVVDANGLDGHTLDASLSRRFWWDDHHIWSFGVGNNL